MAVARFIFSLVVLSLRFFFSVSQTQEVISADPAYYYNTCGTSTCGNLSLLYPFNVPRFCGHPDLRVTCVNNERLVLASNKIPTAEPHRMVSNFSIDSAGISLFIASDALFGCGPVTRKSFMVDPNIFSLSNEYKYGTHLNCTQRPRSAAPGSLQPSSCMGCNGTTTGNNLCLYTSGFVSYPECENFFVYTTEDVNVTAIRDLRDYLKRGFKIRYTTSTACRSCQTTGGRCGSSPSGVFMCFCASSAHRSNCSDGVNEDLRTWLPRGGKSKLSNGVIAAISVSASVVALLAIATAVVVCVIRRKAESKKDDESGSYDKFSTETDFKGAVDGISPTRFSFSQIKKFTSNFSTKLGEGGFGSVYKGSIEGSGAVAVKLLKRLEQSEKQFMNEVATVGRIHHHNLVGLVGYCAQGKNKALVYEFMERGSLDRYIYGKDQEEQQEGKEEKMNLTSQQIYNIAMETARGIFYLHEGCRSRILHLDIKPHNVLLNSNFSAKVADFGLARMIDKDHSHVSLTHAQGTPGYAAPEMWTKTYGPITDKSDVYSYGMLLLEMAGRRKNCDLGEENTSQVYFPDWIFKKAERGELKVGSFVGQVSPVEREGTKTQKGEGEGEEEEEEILEKMSLVGLWCIQHIPANRPTMSKVIQMLEGTVEIGMPPHPFPQEFNEDFPTYYFTAANASVIQSNETDETH
ncbi:LEAF RUST 10 DISEASE-RESISTANCEUS RECEPTOR-LIKE PROTEIN KINASE-like 2.4 [Aristolochia californica]|uniref:LEAF RUST 10 DISEASE-RESISTANCEUS RECEPTOR-LIKE PROTEIN KINASE-like 2.4 n=1 Tax=Aristolochia californica TaxID=171875 RepID=UPI0035D792C7